VNHAYNQLVAALFTTPEAMPNQVSYYSIGVRLLSMCLENVPAIVEHKFANGFCSGQLRTLFCQAYTCQLPRQTDWKFSNENMN